MLNFKNFLKNFTNNLANLNARGQDYTKQVNYLRELFAVKNQILFNLNQLQSHINQASQHFKTGTNPKTTQNNLLFVKKVIQILKTTATIVEADFQDELIQLPNLIAPNTPVGLDKKANKVVFIDSVAKGKSQLSHWEIAQKLSWIENIKAVQMSKSRFVIYQDGGAKLLRVLQNFMLDHHQKLGYSELVVPYLTKEETLIGTGQFPKMKSDAFAIQNHNLFLLPTAEVSLVNFFAHSFLDIKKLPEKVCSYSLCFRQEAGAAGSDTVGLLRMHQFHKVELVKITKSETSDEELVKMVNDAKNILDLLKIPYRIVELCQGELGFAASKTYDLEVWMPFQQKYLEVASLSNTTDFQTNYLQIKYQDEQGKKHFAHTLNGSALAIDRLIACLLEHYYDFKKNVFIYPVVLTKHLQNITWFQDNKANHFHNY